MLFTLLLSLLPTAAIAAQNVTLPSQCACGFVDPSTERLFTDSIIIYFNETNAVDPEIFSILDYRKRVQKGWNVVYRQGADPSNVGIGNNDSLSWQNAIDGTSPSLEMFLSAPTFEHESVGAQLQSLRQDILYGTFRASMRSAQPWVGGSAMSMYLKFNDSVSLEMDMLNKNNASNAQIMQLVNGEYPENKLAINYTYIEEGDLPKYPPHSPWTFMELKMDWTPKSVDFWVNKNRTRAVNIDDRTIPQIPAPLTFSHWSTGDVNYMQGPPVNRSIANVRYVRAFFNSSLMSPNDHLAYDQRCGTVAACSIDDITLRGSTEYPTAAKSPWVQPPAHSYIRKVAGYVAAAFSTFGVASLINAFIRRTPWSKIKKLKSISLPGSKHKKTKDLRRSIRNSIGVVASPYQSGLPQMRPSMPPMPSMPGFETPAPGYETPAPGYQTLSGVMTPLPGYDSRAISPEQSAISLSPKRKGPMARGLNGRSPPISRHPSTKKRNMVEFAQSPLPDPDRVLSISPPPVVIEHVIEEVEEEVDSQAAIADAFNRLEGTDTRPEGFEVGESSRSVSQTESYKSSTGSSSSIDKDSSRWNSMDKKAPFQVVDEVDPPANEVPTEKSFLEASKEKSVPDAMTGAANVDPNLAKAAPKQRIDYLAGLVAVSCIMVTLRHFSLTFWPYITMSQGNVEHFKADKALSFIMGPYILTPLWIGPFFVTSCRFLAQRYLRTGKLNDVGNKMMLRAPRMLIPCFIFMALEYFFISLGLTASLESLPSVSFSTWPYVEPQKNFAVFFNQLVQLSYLIPNGAPDVINNYCVGVLWTIPVQLQFSFVTLMAAVLIKDMKTPWKRLMFYTVTIILGWYANSWSACHWLGLMLADADITYNWIKKVQKRWWLLYPVLLFALSLVAVTPLMLLFNSQIYDFPFMAWENAIHPDLTTGRPIISTVDSIWEAYPPYYYPSAGILAFSVGLQMIVELSTWTQWVLSLKVITYFHPHIMTIYRKHNTYTTR